MLNTAFEPVVTVTLVGCEEIDGGATTNNTAAELVALPPALETTAL
jgi:hypothetical protein